ncbi:unnamed protein product [Aureobasidium mustum]|uniref:Uncharacterized protein n=1 Tax=Aureobasidium mustum TaxID=2773714 RepID=A0A9N8PKW4_9PEZI|nr:unnamed protein product [Aureobasidium mustum]
MKQPEFSTLSPGTVRNSLRCIHRSDNSRKEIRSSSIIVPISMLILLAEAGNLYKFFRQGIANYSKAKGGKYAHLRTCGGSKALRGGETFTVDFDLSGLTNTEIDEIVPYCKPNPDCTNDGQQLHLSDLNYVTSEGKAGRMGWPYDLETMNNYKVTGESEPVESFQVAVSITGDDRDVYEAVVSRFLDNALQQVGTTSTDDFRLDQSMTVTGLPRDLIITRRADSSGERLDFVYGDPTRELAGFAFNTNDSGYSSQFDLESDGTNGYRYCLLEDIKDNDGDIYGQKYVCWFAGW